MLSSAAIIETVTAALDDHDVPLVVDPVIVPQSGDRLLAEEAETVLCEELLPRAGLATLNVPEAEVLTGIPVEDEADLRNAVEEIAADGPDPVLVRGDISSATNSSICCTRSTRLELSPQYYLRDLSNAIY